MTDTDRREFAEILTATMQVYGANLGTAAIGIWWAALAGYSLPEVRAGLSGHVTDPERGRFAPRPADVIARAAESDGRPGADEAWAQCPLNEAQTTVWTDDAREAYFAGAYHILMDGDRIAARMAFKDAYERIVANARRQRKPVTWSASLGHDSRGREPVLLAAVAQGRLAAAHVAGLLPYHGEPAFPIPVKRLN